MLNRVNGALLAILTLALEADMAVDLCEQSIIAADTDIVTRMNVRASLTNEDVARKDELAVRALRT